MHARSTSGTALISQYASPVAESCVYLPDPSTVDDQGPEAEKLAMGVRRQQATKHMVHSPAGFGIEPLYIQTDVIQTSAKLLSIPRKPHLQDVAA